RGALLAKRRMDGQGGRRERPRHGLSSSMSRRKRHRHRHPISHRRRGIARKYVTHREAGKGIWAALLAVAGPGLLAGLSDDDPAGIATYSLLGAAYGYRLLWIIPLATILLVYFHLIAVRI